MKVSNIIKKLGFLYQLTKKIQSVGPDIVSNKQLDHAAIKAYDNIPIPSGEFDAEYHFLMYKKNGHYFSSRHFKMPGNGGIVNYSCQLNEKVEWDSVVAAGHTHLQYNWKNELAINNVKNKYFSAGDPSILISNGEVATFSRTI